MRIISGCARGTQLKTPNGMLTRPTTDKVKESMFNIIQFDIPNAKVLDLFGGTGQLGLEALSRGGAHATFVDLREDACANIRENIRRTHFEGKCNVRKSDYMSFLSSCHDKYDLIFLDPPYAEDFLEKALKKIVEIDILQTGGIIVTERSAGKVFPYEFAGFSRSRDYKYGTILVTIFRKDESL